MIKLFKEVYLTHDSLYNALEKKIIFSKACGGVYPIFTKDITPNNSYLIIDSENNTVEEVFCLDDPMMIASEEEFNGCFESFFNFIEFLNNHEKAIIYADKESYCQILSSWLKIIIPNCDFKHSYEYLQSGILQDYITIENMSSPKPCTSELLDVSLEDWRNHWNKNFIGLEDTDYDLVKFWKIKNITNLDYSFLLANYILDGSFADILKSTLLESIHKEIEKFENKDFSLLAKDIIKNGIKPSEVIEKRGKKEDFDFSKRKTYENTRVPELKKQLKRVQENNITIKDLTSNAEKGNYFFIKYLSKNLNDENFLNNFKL